MGESGGTCRLMMQGISLCDHVTERERDADVLGTTKDAYTQGKRIMNLEF